MENSITKRVKNLQYFGELAIIDFLNKNNIKFKIESGTLNSVYFLVFDEINNGYSYFVDISTSGYIQPDNNVKYATDMQTKKIYDLFIKEHSCEITQEIDKEYDKIEKIMSKKRNKMDSGSSLLHEGYIAIYSKKIKRLIVYPEIISMPTSVVFTLDSDVKRFHEVGYLSNLLHEEAYWRMRNVLDKPLNQYTEDELTLMNMIDI